MRLTATAAALVIVLSVVGGVAAPAAGQGAEGEAYSGANVEFQAQDDAVVDYTVGGTTVLENVTVQSASEARSGAGLDAGADLSAATDVDGAGVEVTSQTRASATVSVESGAEMEAHDTPRGVLQVRADDGDQVVEVNLADGAEAEGTSDGRVVVSTAEGEGAFVVVGDGEVVVNDDGGVTAEVEQGGELVYRQYEGERSDQDDEAERMIAEGVATAEVYVQSSAEDGQETAVHAVEYGQDTAVEAESESRERVEFTVERTESEGKVVLATVSEEAFDATDDLTVYVDGEAAARADSYSAVEQSAAEGDEPRFHVAQSSSAEATTDVAIGIDHFSERNVTLESDGGSDGDGAGGSDDGSDAGDDSAAEGAGFGALVALVSIAAAMVAARRR